MNFEGKFHQLHEADDDDAVAWFEIYDTKL